MKKNIFGIVTALIVFVYTSTCSAVILAEDVALGGIHIRMPIEEVFVLCGEPTRVESDSRIYYGDNDEMLVTFSFKGGTKRIVQSVLLRSNNGMTTPSGISIGTKETDVIQIHGEPDKEEMPSPKFYEQEVKWYGTEFDYKLWYYRADFHGEVLRFGIKDGEVVFIECAKHVW